LKENEGIEKELREELAKVEHTVESITKSLEESERRNSELVAQGIAARKQAAAELEVLTLCFVLSIRNCSHTIGKREL
jgi:septal ring factor EnvC (AmiA/AmiB activator)